MCEYVDTIAHQYTLRLANVAKYMIILDALIKTQLLRLH